MITGVSRIMPIQRASVSSRNPQLSQDRRKKKEQTAVESRFVPAEKTKPTTNKG